MSIQAELLAAQQVPLRYLVRFNPRPTATNSDESCYLPMEAISEFGAVDSSRMRPTTELAHGYSFVADGDVAYAKVTPCFENGKGIRAAGLPEGHAFATTEITVMRPSSQLDSRYLAWILQSEEFRAPGEAHMSGAGGLKRVPESYAARFRVPHPSMDAQRAIADYLDRETAQIDAFIAKNEELIALLTERRAASIDGAMAEHDESRLRLRYRLEANTGGVWGDDPTGVDDTVVLRSTEQTVDGTWRIESPALRALSRADARRFRLREGDLVVTKSSGSEAHIGKATLVDATVAALAPAYSNFMQRLTPSSAMNPKFLWYALRSRAVREQLNLMTTSTTGLGNLNGSILGDLHIPAPTLEKQVMTVAALDRAIRSVNAAISCAIDAVALARERRAALISAAVTGKIDVGVAA